MKIKKKNFEVFSLSFLDIITCGFGAIVLLVLISHTDRDVPELTVEQVENHFSQIVLLQRQVNILLAKIEQQKEKNKIQFEDSRNLNRATQSFLDNIRTKEIEEKELASDLDGLSLTQSSLERISITPTTNNLKRDDEVGGIPVDSDYVVFVIDTSGSMKTIWSRVTQEIINILAIHPQVKGFQILDDQGRSIHAGYEGKWIPDIPFRRKSVMKFFKVWQSASNSSPKEGILIALKKYKKPGHTISIYVFGDDYTGDSYDSVIANITRNNKAQKDGRRIAKIHAIAFPSQYTTDRFGILMRELTKRNNGTFIALPIR